MQNIPHSYVVRANIPDKEEFNWFDGFVHREGEVGFFGKRMFKYLYLNGCKYWDCGDQTTIENLVNRDQYPKNFRDTPPAETGDLFAMQTMDAEDEEVQEYLSQFHFMNVYNPFCGIGRMYDILSGANHDCLSHFVGVDTRRSQLNSFYESRHPHKLYLDNPSHLYLGMADIAVTLEAEQLNAYGLRRIAHMVKDGGDALLFSKKEINLSELDKYRISGNWSSIKLNHWNLLKLNR